jgi:small-conductance mechanosensitive channel
MFSRTLLQQPDEMLGQLRELTPDVIAAVALILAGWLVARLLGSWLRRIATALLARAGGDVTRSRHAGTAGRLVGAFTFWLVFLVFAAAAVDILGLPVVTDTLSRIVYFLPNVLAAGIIVVVGILVGDIARGAVTRTLAAAGTQQAPLAGGVARVLVISIALIVAIEEIGVDGQLLVILAAVIVGAGLSGAGLAFGLGARTSVSNIIASHYLPEGYREGRTIQIDDIKGRIIATTPAAVIIATSEAQVTIPAKLFAERISYLLPEHQ